MDAAYNAVAAMFQSAPAPEVKKGTPPDPEEVIKNPEAFNPTPPELRNRQQELPVRLEEDE